MDPNKLMEGWSLHRQDLERNLRVLLVEVNRQFRGQLEELLKRCGCAVSTAVSAEASLELVLTGQFPLVVVPSALIEMDGLVLVDQMRRQVSDLEVILTTRDITLELVQRAFDLQIRDIIQKPIITMEALVNQVLAAIQHSINNQMRLFLLVRLRRMLTELSPEQRHEAVVQLERRLMAYKAWLGRCDKLMVVESEAQLRNLSESLFEARFNMEAAGQLDGAIRRASKGDINLLFLQSTLEPARIQLELDRIKERVPQMDVVFIAPPQLQTALAALHAGAALYLPRVPNSTEPLVPRVRRVLAHHRERRLMDNLLLELFLELLRIQGYPVDHGLLERFHSLVGSYHGDTIPPEEELEDPEVRQSVDFLDEVLSDMIGDDDDAAAERVRDQAGGAERRIFPRLPEQRVVRFGPSAVKSKKLAYMGNFSEGGLFIQTGDMLSPGTLTELDMTLSSQAGLHQIACKGRVVWVSPDGTGSEHGPGIGLKFLVPSEQMSSMLRQIIKGRLSET